MRTRKEPADGKRLQTTIDYYPEAVEAIDSIVKKIGSRGTRKSLLTKLFVWFSQQDELVQLAIIGFKHPAILRAQADALRKMADDLDRPEPIRRKKIVGGQVLDDD